MDRLSKKLIVYLDQNFISEISKAENNVHINPKFKKIFDLLHKGFLEEKTVVPNSFFHDIETSLAPNLKDEINKYLGYLGQLKTIPEESVKTFQIERAINNFLGVKNKKEDYGVAFNDNPDHIIERFNVSIDMHWEKFYSVNGRKQVAIKLDQVRQTVKNNKFSFKKQLKKEFDAAVNYFLRFNKKSWLWKLKDESKIVDFAHSDYFKNIPTVNIRCKMWACLLSDFHERNIKSGDSTDIDIISTYLPYVDVLATDNFMFSVIKRLGINKEYNTKIFSSKSNKLQKFEKFLKKYISHAKPINIPIASIFVLSNSKIKKESFDFFKKLGNQTMNKRNGWVELYAFDDGYMPEYLDKRTGQKLPFYGLQNVHQIKIDGNHVDRKKILNICRKKTRSKKFIFIDHYRNLQPNFIETLIEKCKSRDSKILDFSIIEE